MIESGELTVDIETCEVCRHGKLKKPSWVGTAGRNGRRLRFEFRVKNRVKRTIVRARLIYLAATERLIPENYIVHHVDLNRTNDAFSNLAAVHKDDHPKFHGKFSYDKGVPF